MGKLKETFQITFVTWSSSLLTLQCLEIVLELVNYISFTFFFRDEDGFGILPISSGYNLVSRHALEQVYI